MSCAACSHREAAWYSALPDYANWQWVWMEKAYGFAAPGGYADEHIAHYTYAELMDIFAKRGFTFEESRYILRGELHHGLSQESPLIEIWRARA